MLTAPVCSFHTQRCSHTFLIHLWLGIELSQASAELLPRSKAQNVFPCREGLSTASFRTCWSQSLHETKYCLRTMPRVLLLCPTPSLGGQCYAFDSFPASVIQQLRLQCKSPAHTDVRWIVTAVRLASSVSSHTFFERSSSQNLFDLFNTKVGISNLIWLSVSQHLKKALSQNMITDSIVTVFAIGLLSLSGLWTCTCFCTCSCHYLPYGM